ncbi:glycosyltransferase family 25 protein [Pseudohoeflea coraliihabitans]|nr:glycosyltransferase family 25 protein [Pseudohoeflea sp. DP4N28-3]
MPSIEGLNCYLINLDRAPARLAFMDAQLQSLGLPYQRVSAVDKNSIGPTVEGYDAAAYRRLHGRRFHAGEIACYLSHVACLRAFLASEAAHALILEDDARLPEDLPQLLTAALGAADEWDLLRLSTVNSGIRAPYRPLVGRYQMAIALTREKGAGAYLVNRRCAQTLLAREMPIRLAWDIAFDLEFRHGLRGAFIVPIPVDQCTGMETQIQHQTAEAKLPASRYLTVFPFRAMVETQRFLKRGSRLIWLKARQLRTPAGPTG